MEKPFMQTCIAFIEEQLDQDVSVAVLAKEMGYSLFHFHRKFQQEFQMTATAYIKGRRLARASSLLLYTEERVMDIAFVSGFESQEAFTRAFKKQYGLPPGRYRHLMNMIQEGGSQMENASPIKKWFLAGSEPDQYEVGLDQQEVHHGKQSAYLKSKSANETAHLKLQSLEGMIQFGTLMQQCKAANYTGKRIKLSGFIRTEKVHVSAGLWMRVDSKDGDVLQFDNMSNRTITGDTGWNVYSIVLDIPNEAAAIAFGVLLSGTGSVWLDSLSFQEVDDRTPTTNLEIDFELHEEPMNLSFEME